MTKDCLDLKQFKTHEKLIWILKQVKIATIDLLQNQGNCGNRFKFNICVGKEMPRGEGLFVIFVFSE